ncbi:hypothetical protein PR048_009022, partial [Dryococelus australis]
MSHNRDLKIQLFRVQNILQTSQSNWLQKHKDYIKDTVENIKPWRGVYAIPGISKFHAIKSVCGAVQCQNDSLSSEVTKFGDSGARFCFDDLGIGQWVTVKYGVEYRGEVTEMHQDGATVKVIHSSEVSGFFKWSKHCDKI